MEWKLANPYGLTFFSLTKHHLNLRMKFEKFSTALADNFKAMFIRICCKYVGYAVC